MRNLVKMEKTFQTLLVLFCSIAALIHSENSSAQSYEILQTVPSGAIVADSGGQELGKTPFNLSSLRNPDSYIKVSLEDYDPVELYLFRKGKEMQFPHSVYACSSCIVVLPESAADEEKDNSIKLRLRKKVPEHSKSILVALDTIVLDMPQKQELGKINGSVKKLGEGDLSRITGIIENISNEVLNAFDDSYLDVRNIVSKAGEKTTLYKPKLIIRPYIKKLRFNFKGKILREYTGPCVMECVWKVTNIRDRTKVLGEFPVKTSYYRTGNSYDIPLHQVLAESAKDLMLIDTLFSFMERMEKEYLKGTKGEEFKIKGSAPVVFANNKEMFQTALAAVVTIENEDGFGSGVIISPDGFVITNYHVIEKEKDISIRIKQDKKVSAIVIRVNKDYDLALLKITGDDFKTLPFGNSDSAEIGDEIFAVGTPLNKSLGQTITKGIISGFREYNGVNLIQTDVSINWGNSGGPVINQNGRIVGIATMKVSGKGVEGIGFCIPANQVQEMLNIKLE